MAIVQVSLHLPAPPVNKWKILLDQSCSAHKHLLAASNTFGSVKGSLKLKAVRCIFSEWLTEIYGTGIYFQ